MSKPNRNAGTAAGEPQPRRPDGCVRQKVKQGRTQEITGSDQDAAPRQRPAHVIDLAELLQNSLGRSKSAPRLQAVPRAAASAAARVARTPDKRKRV